MGKLTVRRRGLIFTATIFVIATASLSSGCAAEPAAPTSDETKAVRAYQPLAGFNGIKRSIGEDCLEGQEVCGTGFCLHTQPDPLSGYVCTTPCTTDQVCPGEGWSCQRIAGTYEAVCVPPSAWHPRPISPRQKSLVSQRPVPDAGTIGDFPLGNGPRLDGGSR